jgi:outer membrane protein insertion porin family
LKRQYLSHGLYGVKITTTVTPIERNRVTIMFNVDEGDVAKIKGINIVGNKAFSDKQLREMLQLNTSGWFTWYSKADQYSKQKLTGDLEAHQVLVPEPRLPRSQVESTQVAITPDKKDIYLTINITEGEKYTVSGVKLEGEMFGREEELKQLILLRPARPIRANCRKPRTSASPSAWELRLRLRQRHRQPGNQPREARSRLHLPGRSGQARLRAPHDHLGQHDHPR